jgi:hypothetical protein
MSPTSYSTGSECTQPSREGRRQMKMTFVVVASAATTIMLLGACTEDPDTSTTTSGSPTSTSETVDDGPTTLAKGEDVALVGDSHSGLGAQTLNVTAEEENGNVTGEFRITDNVIRVECADTHTDGVVILGGETTEGPDFSEGDLFALVIREGDPASVSLYGNDSGAGSCTELIESIPADSLTDDSNFVDIEDGYNIEIG